jgi:hypothetical protein
MQNGKAPMTKVTAAKRLEAIGLNDPTVAALLKELEENAMAKSEAEPPKEVRDAWQHYYHEAPVDFDPVAEEIFEAGWKAALAQSDAQSKGGDAVLPRSYEPLTQGPGDTANSPGPQSDAEPVYFHRYENTSRWIECSLYEYEAAKELKNTETRVLYTAPPRPDADSDGVTRKDVDSWVRYFDEHAEEFVAAHAAIIRKAAQNG